MRAEFVRGMEFAGVKLDGGKNAAAKGAADVSTQDSRVKVGGWGGGGGSGGGGGAGGRWGAGGRRGRGAGRVPPGAGRPPPPPTRCPFHPTSPCTQLLVIPTDEELSIAQQTLEVIRTQKGTATAA